MWKYVLLVMILVIVLAFYWSTCIYGDLEQFVVRYDDLEVIGVPKLQKEEVLKQPYIEYPRANSKKLYTVALVDPTAPDTNHPDKGVWRHWLVSDIPGKKLQQGLKNPEGSGTIITPYQEPNPPPGSGRHLYQVRLYEQSSKITGPTDYVKEGRRNWPIELFVDGNNLYAVAQKTFTVRGK